MVEAAVRMLRPFPLYRIEHQWVRLSEDPDLGYELNPALPDHNADGMRDRSFPRAKPEGVTRIAAIGDSTTYGFGVRSEESWPKQLEDSLASQHRNLCARRFEVLNFGVPGYSIAQEQVVLEHRALRFDPDFVVLVLSLNDWSSASIAIDQLLADAERQGDGFVSELFGFARGGLARVLGNLHTYRWLRHGLGVLRSRAPSEHRLAAHSTGTSFFAPRFRSVVDRAVDAHVGLVVALLPVLDPGRMPEYRDRLGELYGECQGGRCAVIDALSVLAGSDEPLANWDQLASLYRSGDPIHFSAEGNAVIAAAIRQSLDHEMCDLTHP